MRPTPAQIDSACLSFRHDFGILPADKQRQLQFEATEWLIAWQKEGFACAQEARPTREQMIAAAQAVIDAPMEMKARAPISHRIVDAITALYTTAGGLAGPVDRSLADGDGSKETV